MIFLFSVVFPMVKLVALLVLWFVKVAARRRVTILHWLSVLGKWSMLDVCVIAMVVVIVKAGGLITAQARVGLYVFGLAIVASMLISMYGDHPARHAQAPLLDPVG